VDLKWHVKIEKIFGSIFCHLTLDGSVFIRVDDNEGKLNAILCGGLTGPLIPFNKVLDCDLLSLTVYGTCYEGENLNGQKHQRNTWQSVKVNTAV